MENKFRFCDLIIRNARLYDPPREQLAATALAVSGNTILAAGADSDILNLRHAGTRVIDAGGRWLLPAFTDAHTHLLGYVRRRQEVSLYHCTSLGQALDEVRKKVAETPEGEWVTGGGWNRNIWGENEFPNRRQLDDISTRHFIALDSKDWHTAWVNTPVLELAGIPADRPYPGARHLAVDPVSGEFTGVLEEDIRLKVFDLIPPPDFRRLEQSYRQTVQEFYQLGFTGIHSVETPAEFAIYQEARRQGTQGLRTAWYLPVKHAAAAAEISLQQDVGDDMLRIAGAKIFVDGAFGSQTAELLGDYRELGHAGVEVLTEGELNALVEQAVNAGLSCAVHAIGDRAIRKTLRVFGRHRQKSREFGLRHRIEHAQLIHPNDLPLFAEYNVYASVQPVHLAADIPIINRYLGDRGRYAYPYASLKNSGAKILFGSDTPVEPFNPWQAIYSAMERRENLDPRQPAFYPAEGLTLPDCLQAYTGLPAEAAGLENRLGGIRPGMLADFFLTDRDIFTIPSAELPQTRSLLTVFNGRVVHRETD